MFNFFFQEQKTGAWRAMEVKTLAWQGKSGANRPAFRTIEPDDEPQGGTERATG